MQESVVWSWRSREILNIKMLFLSSLECAEILYCLQHCNGSFFTLFIIQVCLFSFVSSFSNTGFSACKLDPLFQTLSYFLFSYHSRYPLGVNLLQEAFPNHIWEIQYPPWRETVAWIIYTNVLIPWVK